MDLHFGENLKRLRQKKDLTQEQLAEILNVSPQAVSRWENNSSYPDITLLPGIAVFYQITLDELLGMERIRSAESIAEIHRTVHKLVREERLEEAAALCREGLKHAPDNTGLMLSLSETLAQIETPDASQEAVSLLERVLQKNELSAKSRSTGMITLIFLYLRLGKKQEATQLTASLPHIWESRELLLPETLENPDYKPALKEAIQKALRVLCRNIDTVFCRRFGTPPDYLQLGIDFDRVYSPKEMLEKISDFLTSD